MWCGSYCYRIPSLVTKQFSFNLRIQNYSLICSLLENPNVGNDAEVKGWVKNLRNQKQNIFADINDGSCSQKLQVIIPKHLKPESLTYGSSVHILGKLSTGPKGQLELVANSVNVLGECVVADGYPFNPRTTHPSEYIRQFLHFRSRTNYIAAILRVRNTVNKHIHDYFASKSYIHINTPILTSNDCEGAGEVFKVQPENEQTIKEMMQEGKNHDSVYFGSKTFLTVSGQLHLEAVCRGMGNVYTLGPTFRAENSKSRLHLSEFYMLEAELAFCNTLEELQNAIEEFVKYVFISTIKSNEADLNIIEKGNIKTLNWIEKPFITITYDEAKEILSKKKLIISNENGINKEQELALVEYFKVPVFIVGWPRELKSFYMKENQDDSTKVDALDLLMPVTGEVVGGSLREDNYEKLKSKLPSDRLQWYLDLRKFGNIPTGGFGLGIERLLQVLCGVNNIKDTLPFPRWPHNCDM